MKAGLGVLEVPIIRLREEPQSDSTLLAGCLSKDAATANRAFEQLVRSHQESVYGLCYRFFGNHAEAAEVSQRTFIRVFQKLSTFRQASSLRTWIYRIAVNLCKNYRRDESRHTAKRVDLVEHEEHGAVVGDSSAGDNRKLRAALRRAMEGLPPMQKSVMILRVYEELSFKEIAQVVGSSEGAAKVNFHHALNHLKEEFDAR